MSLNTTSKAWIDWAYRHLKDHYVWHPFPDISFSSLNKKSGLKSQFYHTCYPSQLTIMEVPNQSPNMRTKAHTDNVNGCCRGSQGLQVIIQICISIEERWNTQQLHNTWCRIALEVYSGEQTRCGNDGYCPFCFSESFFWSTHAKPALTRLVRCFWSWLRSLLLLFPWFISDGTSSSQLSNLCSPIQSFPQ